MTTTDNVGSDTYIDSSTDSLVLESARDPITIGWDESYDSWDNGWIIEGTVSLQTASASEHILSVYDESDEPVVHVLLGFDHGDSQYFKIDGKLIESDGEHTVPWDTADRQAWLSYELTHEMGKYTLRIWFDNEKNNNESGNHLPEQKPADPQIIATGESPSEKVHSVVFRLLSAEHESQVKHDRFSWKPVS